MRILCALIAILTLTVNHDTIGQRFYSINDALPFARTRCVYQDSFGFLWFGTEDGLVKYDGLEARVYRNTPGDTNSLPGQEIHAVIQNSDTTLLLGFQDQGLVLFNRNTGHSQKIHLTQPDSRLTVYSLFIDAADITWIGTTDGLYVLDGAQITHFAANPQQQHGLLDPSVYVIYQDKHMNLWIGTRGGIHRLDVQSGLFENPLTNSTYPDKIIIDIDEDGTGILWVSVRTGPNRLYQWNQDEGQFIVQTRFIRDGEYRIDFDTQDKLWISSRGRGIYRIDRDKEIFFDPAQPWKHGFWGLGVFDILHDKYRNIWVLGEEVFKWSGNNKGFNFLEGDNFVIHSVYADDQYIWYCGNDPVRWNRETGQTEQFLSDVQLSEIRNEIALKSQSRVYHFEEWGDDLIMCTTRNVIWWDRSTDRFRDMPTNAGGPLRDAVIDAEDYAWIAVNQNVPMRINLHTGQWTRPDTLSRANTTHAVAMSKDGLLWWGNRLDGLFSYDPVTEQLDQYVPDPNNPSGSIGSYTIHDILCHSDGKVWVGTNFGLDVVDPTNHHVQRYTFEGHNVNTQITSILEGEAGTLWLGTKNGLLYLNPVSDSLRRFSRDDGLINTVYTERACYRDRHGVLYFGGDAGVDFFHPDDIGSNPVPPDLYIKSVSVNNRSLTSTTAGELLTKLSLTYQDKVIEIELLGLQLSAPASVIYAYRMPGQSDAWIDLGRNHTITLVNLSPGRYILEGKSANADRVWSSPKRLLSITIAPPFWQTTWFIALIGALVTSLIYAGYRVRIRQIRNSEKIKTDFNKRIAEIEMKALRAQMNPHFLFNSLNSVRLLIDKGNNEEAKHYLTRYGQLIRLVLKNSRRKFIRLDEELETLRLYLELEQMRFKNFDYKIIVDPNVETDFLEVPPLVLQPYVENALWHGLMNKQHGDRHLRIEIKRVNDLVHVSIEDNGIGRKQAEALKTGNKSNKESLGLKISEERLGYLKELYGSEVHVDITDLENETGTRVNITLPVPE